VKKVIAILIGDTHLKESNIEENINIYIQVIKLAKKYGVNVFHGGDVWDSRKSQSLINLEVFYEILELFREENLMLQAIPGNHCRTNYSSEESYLDIYQDHPNFILTRGYDYLDFEKLRLHFIPYFDEKDTYGKYLKQVKLKKGVKNILQTHIAINGVKNNDGTTIENDLNKNLFKQFDKVLVHHYHNQSKIGNNIYYVGGGFPHNFGETNEKGISILFDDGSHEFVKLEFREYHKIKVDIDKTSEAKIEKLLSKWGDSEHNIRFQFFGNVAKLDALNVNRFKQKGIDVKIKRPDVDAGMISAQKQEFISFNKDSIKKEFVKFAKYNKIKDLKVGQKYLNQILN